VMGPGGVEIEMGVANEDETVGIRGMEVLIGTEGENEGKETRGKVKVESKSVVANEVANEVARRRVEPHHNTTCYSSRDPSNNSTISAAARFRFRAARYKTIARRPSLFLGQYPSPPLHSTQPLIMSSSSSSTIAAATEKVVATVNKPRSLSVFLELAPVLSTSYPAQPSSRTSSTASSVPPKFDPSLLAVEPATSAVDLSAPAEASDQTHKDRRSSSVSSTSSARQRFLKLGPVHFGGDPLESDWVDAEGAGRS